jgi:predicted PurR-regulated permease PerM
MYKIEGTKEKSTMKTMMVRGSPILRYMLAAAAIVIVVFGLKYSSDVLAPIFFAATLAILFTPALWWLEKKGLPAWLALLVMVLALGGFIIVMIIILTASLQQLSVLLPHYEELLLQRIDAFTVALGSIGIDLQGALNDFVKDTTAIATTVINVALGLLSNSVAVVFFLFLLFLMLVESKSIATKFQTRLQTGNNFVIQLGNYSKQIQKQYRIQTLSNLLSAVAITVVLLLFRVDLAVLWGFLAFVLGFIPNVGLIIAILPAVIIAFILYGLGTALVILALVIILNAAMDNAVTPRIMGKGLNLPILLVFLSFLFWSWVFGFVGALLAIPATLFVKTLLQGRQETRFLVVLLSGQGDSDTTVTIPEERRDESTAVEEQSDTPDTSRATLIVDSTDSPVHEE